MEFPISPGQMGRMGSTGANVTAPVFETRNAAMGGRVPVGIAPALPLPLPPELFTAAAAVPRSVQSASIGQPLASKMRSDSGPRPFFSALSAHDGINSLGAGTVGTPMLALA